MKPASLITSVLILIAATAFAQGPDGRPQGPRPRPEAGRPPVPPDREDWLGYEIAESGDTVFLDELPAAKVYARLPRQKGREWRKYYRLVHNFSKTYPYKSRSEALPSRRVRF